MQQFHFEQALLDEGWTADVMAEVDDDGIIRKLEKSGAGKDSRRIKGAMIPGMPDLHSHAFQRAMAGLAEKRSSPTDSFWNWRKVMYGFLDLLEPEDVEAITAQLYMELLKGGYTSIAEFHYLHHGRDGAPYGDVARMSDAVIAAADTAGMPLTLLPVFYAHAGFGGLPPEAGQRRFINDLDRFQKLFSVLETRAAGNPLLTLGIAPHSLRAATREEIAVLLEMAPSSPFHIHIAEQQKEVADCEAAYGTRPVEWLYRHFDVDGRWCLVHATHVTAAELGTIAKSGAVAGLCPLTEANLGDGIFPARDFFAAGGAFGIGSDSNVSTLAVRELESLEYAQRLSRRERNVLTSEAEANVGTFLYRAALAGGARALGQPVGAMREGMRADFIVLDLDHPDLYGRPMETILDILIFANSGHLIRDVFIAGEQRVAAGRHVNEKEISDTYRRHMKALLARL